MDKFCLKWNDFQATVTQSLSLLRRDEDFFDVTLVSDDNVQLQAHKVILSASSSFFKSIVKRNSHSHPLLYLHGVNSANLGFILDYIYQGEVQIYQNQLNSFLDVVQILQISGLIAADSEKQDNSATDTTNMGIDIKEDIEDFSASDQVHQNLELDVVKHFEDKPRNRRRYPLQAQAGTEIQQKINDMLDKSLDGTFNCTECGKTGKDSSNMRKHIETHIEGLSYSCPNCTKTFRSKQSFRNHLSLYHK